MSSMSLRLRPFLRTQARVLSTTSIRPIASFTLRPPTSVSSPISGTESTFEGIAPTNKLNINLTSQARGINTTSPLGLEASARAEDGGVEEAPHSGINVDKSIRMDTCVSSSFL
ncbi:hypothetical protein M231_03147 [Tremella mesenterica]|uniref:Uncharacterized protein n=1 Tax=Tremella mesenterica TaxID=5217 RepID=A0A4Q1BNN2_TREME|nr:hypothetical protein M231_03147 [Tremella mesenterica]